MSPMRFTRGIALLSVVLMAGCYVDDEIEPDFGGGAGGGGGETDGSLPDACDEGAVEACFVEGECRGERVCTNGAFGECTAPAEVCDGRDNDCDGEADEGYAGLGDACQAGEGACVDRGRIVCTEDGTDVVCDATPGDGTTDVCDAIDNDCDGTVDEEATLGEACDTGRLGVCAAGIIGCTDGDTRCAPSTDASDEICDGLDNDCDGRVDEDGLGGLLAEPCYEGPEGTDGVGICASGVRLCVDGAFDACTGAVTPLEEICDGLDNDCDGTVDTDDCACVPGEARACYSGPEGTEGIGACAPGRQVCGADGTFGACRGEVTPTAEACDGVDNDCDGAVDDVPGAGQPCTDGVGACAVDGSRVCDLESGRLVCDAVAGAPADEVCDGVDNDCDGTVDDVEGVGELCTTGEGACFNRGAQRCIDGALACDAVEGEPSAETCNQIDDDCNGEVDDVPGLDEHCEIGTGICRSTALTKCDYETGAVFCPATEQDPEPADYCGNRVDDDCDGEVDEEGCAIRCAGDDDCPDGYCNGRVCVACLADADCGDGDICVDGACVAPLDSDGDGIADVVDVDDDNDGIPDASECFGALDGQTSVINGGFEVPPVAPGANRQTPEADVPGWETTEGPGSIEMWGTGFLGVPAAVGGAFAEINAFEADGALYQDIATIPGTIFTWSFYHRGRLGEDELELRAGPPDATVTITTAATGNQAWRRYTGTYVVPDGQMLTRFEFRSIRSTGGAGLGNFVDGVEFLPACPADADADGDGIPNALDLDSDDDGIPDAEEAGHDQPHTDGRVDGPVGGNGLVDALETVPDSGIIDYELRDSDGDGIYDFLDPDGGPGCGNGLPDEGEECDDGNTDDDDGCSRACRIEDGFDCTPAGGGLGPCVDGQPVETLQLTPGDFLPISGGNGGSPFDDPCAPGEVATGFVLSVDSAWGRGQTFVQASRAQCAALDVVDGQIVLTPTDLTPVRGEYNPAQRVDCPAGAVIIGYIGYEAPRDDGVFPGTFASAFGLVCGTPRVVGDTVVVEDVVDTDIVGDQRDFVGRFVCPEGALVGGNAGRSGGIVDQVTVRCDTFAEACDYAPGASTCEPIGGAPVCPDGGAPGACPPGFEATPDGLGCERLTREPAQLNGEPLEICRAIQSDVWGRDGVLLPGGTTFDGGFFGEGSAGSRQNTVGVWACAPGGGVGNEPVNEAIGFARCFQIEEGGEYVLGIGVDDDAVLTIDGEEIFRQEAALFAWHLVPVQLSAGTHILTLEGINSGGPGGLGAEIYGPYAPGSTDTDDELMALDYENNIVFTSLDQIGSTFDTGATNGYSCPEGLALDLCGAEAQCTAFERLDACLLAPCGNGALDDGETCDDGNRQNGDGCDSTCQVEDGYLCDDPGLGPCAPDQTVETIDLVPGDNLPAVGGQGGSPFADSCPIGEVIVGFDYRIGDSFGGNTYIERSRAQCARLDLVAGEARLTLTGVTPERGGPPASGVPPGYTHEVRCPEGQLVRGYTGYGDAYVSGVALLCSTLTVEAGGVVLGAPVEQPPVGRTDNDLGTFTCPDAHVVGANSGRHGFIIDQFTMRCDAIVEACRTNSVCETDGEICDDQRDNDDDGDIDCRDADCDGAAACDGACFSDDDCLDGEICTDGFCAQSDDRDGDGVPDVRDLDDDNDGILDTDECTPGLGAVINSSFEAPVIADGAFLYIQPQDQGGAFGWTTNVPDQPVEIQGRGHATAPEAALGRQYGEANAAVVGGFYQDVATVPGHTYEWTMYHRGRDGVDSLQVRFGAPGPVETLTPIVTAVTDNDAWILYSGTYTVPAGQEITRLSFATIFAAGGASRGNFIDGFTFTPVCDLDTDGDGLVNSRDLDSDADGIPDAEEAGHDQPHTNGVVDGPVGGNGVPDAVETVPDSSDVAYTLRETDGDGIFDFLDDDEGAGPAEICDNDADDDDDGAVDCEDRDCNLDPACAVTRTVYFTAPANGLPIEYPGVPTRLYTIDGEGNLQLLGDILLDGEPIAVSAIALSPDGTLVGFQHRAVPIGSRLITIDPDTATAVVTGEYVDAYIDGAAFAPDGTLYVTDDGNNQVRVYDGGLGAVVLDYPEPFLGADIAIDLDGSCYLTGVGPDFTQYPLYACDLEAGTTESLGAYTDNPGFDSDGHTTIPAMAFSYDPATCSSRLYAFDSYSVDELGYLDVSADPPTMNHIASTGINFAYYLTPDMAGFPSVANAPDCDGPVEICDDGVDNDDDGDVDCGDVDCRDDAACAIESTFYFTTPSQAGTPEPVAPTRLYTLNSAGDLLLLGDVTLDGVPAIVTALALSPAGELYGFERHSDLPESRLIAIDRETGAAVPVGDFIAGEIMGAGFDPDGRLWVLDDTTQQLAEYIDGALAPSLDLPVQFDGGDIAFDATGACYLTGAALGGVGALDLYRCDPDAGTLESIGALATEGFIDAEGDVHVTAIAFSYDDVTCASTLYALDGLAIDELGTIDVGADPPLMSQVASTGVNYSWFTTPDGAGFPSVVNSPACAGRVEICDNDQDDDGNGAIDCDDIACQGVPACPIDLPDFEVTVRGFDMLPGSARVPVGTTVRWTNEDGARHTVTSGAPGDADAGAIFDGDLPGNGGTFAFTFDAPGEYPYFCRPHAGSMFGYSIIVE